MNAEIMNERLQWARKTLKLARLVEMSVVM